MLKFWISKNVFPRLWKKTYLLAKVTYESSTSYDEYIVSIIISNPPPVPEVFLLWTAGQARKKRNWESSQVRRLSFADFLSSLIKLENNSNSTRRMAAPPSQRSGGGRTTSLRGDTYESDKLESTTSWDALEWTKIEVPSQFPSNSRVSSLPLFHLSNSLYFGLLFLIEILFLFLPIRIFLLFTARFAVRFACEIRFPAWSRTSHSRGASSLCFNCLLYL